RPRKGRTPPCRQSHQFRLRPLTKQRPYICKVFIERPCGKRHLGQNEQQANTCCLTDCPFTFTGSLHAAPGKVREDSQSYASPPTRATATDVCFGSKTDICSANRHVS